MKKQIIMLLVLVILMAGCGHEDATTTDSTPTDSTQVFSNVSTNETSTNPIYNICAGCFQADKFCKFAVVRNPDGSGTDTVTAFCVEYSSL